MKLPAINIIKLANWAILAASVLFTAFLFIRFFEQLPTEGTSLGIDWIHDAIKDGNIYYQITDGLRNPPWSVLPILPLGFMSRNAGWGMLVYINFLTLIVSVPQTRPKWFYWMTIFLTVLAYPALRTSADGNYEIPVTIGALLLVYGYKTTNPVILALGVLMITAKPQSALVMLIVTAVYVLQTWTPKNWLITGAVILAVVIPTMIWRGEDWLKAVDGTYQRGSLMDISMDAAMLRTEIIPEPVRWIVRGIIFVVTLYIAWVTNRTLSREKAGFLIAASLLIAPYSAGNSILAVYAIGIIPLFVVDPKRLGGLLVLLINLPYVLVFSGNPAFGAEYQSYYTTSVLFLSWIILGWRCYTREKGNHSAIPHTRTDPSVSENASSEPSSLNVRSVTLSA